MSCQNPETSPEELRQFLFENNLGIFEEEDYVPGKEIDLDLLLSTTFKDMLIQARQVAYSNSLGHTDAVFFSSNWRDEEEKVIGIIDDVEVKGVRPVYEEGRIGWMIMNLANSFFID